VENRREIKKCSERQDGCSREEKHISVKKRREDKEAE